MSLFTNPYDPYISLVVNKEFLKDIPSVGRCPDDPPRAVPSPSFTLPIISINRLALKTLFVDLLGMRNVDLRKKSEHEKYG